MTQNIAAQFPIVPKANLLYGDSCAICHETYASEDPVRLPCGHEFGFDCISTWLSPAGGRKTCPLCRHQLVVDTSASDAEEVRAIMAHIVTAAELNIELTERGLAMRRSGRYRDWLLYLELRSQGANLPPPPPLYSDSGEMLTELGPSHEDALFRELQRRGAFLVLPMDVGPLVNLREIWDWLQIHGYSWHPRHAANAADNCGWMRSQETYPRTYSVDWLMNG